jgi:hypothetical protein
MKPPDIDTPSLLLGMGGFSFDTLRRSKKTIIRERGFYVYLVVFNKYLTIEVNFKPILMSGVV